MCVICNTVATAAVVGAASVPGLRYRICAAFNKFFVVTHIRKPAV